MRRVLTTVLLLWTLLAAGCAATEERPQFYQTRTIEEQRANAQRFDPYPEPEVGPNITGTRPRDYARPVAEPSRARWDPRTWFSRWGS